ncbi:MAG: glycosyltransferase family 1 protein [Candidatus Omnitrophota bacterium]
MPIVGFDAQATQGRQSGLGVYTRHLLAAIKHKIKAPMALAPFFDPMAPGQDLKTLDRLRWENRTLPKLVKRHRVDLLHVPAFSPAFLKPCPLVVTVHDLAGLRFSNQMGIASYFYWRYWLPYTIRQADKLIAISEHTKKDLVSCLGIRERKISVVYSSGHEGFTDQISRETIAGLMQQLKIRDKYFISVGTLEPRKNLSRIVAAFLLFSKTHPGYQLVMVGSSAFAHGKYAQRLSREHADGSDRIVVTGFLDHEQLNALYCGAQGLLFPSLYEGFGIPILEAMASGCPVLTSNITSMPEVAGDAGLLVSPVDVLQIAQGMTRLAEDTPLWQDLRLRGKEQIKKFSWDRTAEGTLNVYESLIK